MSRIVYICWPAEIMAGGIKMVFRHVEALNERGFEACVATPDARPPGWFESTAPLVSVQHLVRDSDVLVFPENYAAMLQGFASWSNRRVVFCQSQHKVLLGLAGRQDYADYGVQHMICPSPMLAAYCRRRFPTQNIFIVPNYVDANVFQPVRGAGGSPAVREVKKLQIAFAPGKRPVEADFIRDLFCSDNPNFSSVPWIKIAGVPERQVAGILRESSLYLALPRFEAFGLSTLEALAAGCVVAGFTGLGGRDYATPGNGFWATEDDCLECTDQLTLATRLIFEGGERYGRMVDEALRTAKGYDRAGFVDRLAACWRSILDR